ncbi:MAG: hypothetical protein ACRDTA_29025 [Pseudonocardiaceae bacterium]
MTVLQNSFLIAGGNAVLYAATVTVIALISVLAPTPERRRDALKVLKILLPPLR